MGRNSGGTGVGGFNPGDANKGGIEAKNLRGLVTVKDPQVYKELKQGISRFHSTLGVREREVKIGDLPSSVNGVHYTSVSTGKSKGIVLNAKVFDMKKSSIEARTKKAYNAGWATKTKKPLQHTVTHELAHATWNTHLKGANQKAAGIEIKKLYNKWRVDKNKKGYGKYAKTSVNEFWAETATKAIHGNADKYTRKVKYICRRYKL